MAAIVAHHAFGHAGRARGVEDVERVGRHDRHAAYGFRRLRQLLPVMVAAGARGRRDTSAAAGSRNAPAATSPRRSPRRAAACRGRCARLRCRTEAESTTLRLGVVDPGRQLVRGKAAKHDRMDGADAGAGEHRHRRLGHHRHVDQHPVALADAEPGKNAGEPRHLVAQFAVGEMRGLAGDRAVLDQRYALATPGVDMPVERVPAGVEPAAARTSDKRAAGSGRAPGPSAAPNRSPRRLRPRTPRAARSPAGSFRHNPPSRSPPVPPLDSPRSNAVCQATAPACW